MGLFRVRLKCIDVFGNLIDLLFGQYPVTAERNHDAVRVCNRGIPDLVTQLVLVRIALFHGNQGRSDIAGKGAVFNDMAGKAVAKLAVKCNGFPLFDNRTCFLCCCSLERGKDQCAEYSSK